MPNLEEGKAPIADREWGEEVKVLTYLARRRKISDIASQFGMYDKWVARIRDKARDYPASLVATLPLEVQDYLVKINAKRRPGLKVELDSIREKQSTSSPSKLPSPYGDDIRIHWNELAEKADSLATSLRRISHLIPKSDEFLWEVAVNWDEQDFLEFLHEPLPGYLLVHMKIDLPQLDALQRWSELRLSDIDDVLLDQLSLRAAQRKFEGKCKVCESLVGR